MLSIPGVQGSAFVLSGSTTTGPLATKLLVFQSSSTANGQVIFGGGFSGRDTVVSVIGGDAVPDLGITAQASTTLDIIDGRKVPALTGPVDAKATGDVHVPMPSGWTGTALGPANLIPDIDGDSYPDFALADQFGTVPGRVAIFW
jgi:hypothetical protein